MSDVQGVINLLTWNVNGIRTFKSGSSTLKQVLDSLNSDIICLQETKVPRDMLEEEIAMVDGYTSYFAFCRKKSGYSGVVTYCKSAVTPVRAEEGLSGMLATVSSSSDLVGSYGTAITERFSSQELKDLDIEGRAVITQHKIMLDCGSIALLSIINVYCPRVDPERPDRLKYKLDFLRLLQLRWQALQASGSKVIVVGDLNISHKTIDHCDPSPESEFNADPSRQWLSSILDAYSTTEASLIDVFRYIHHDRTQAFTCWNTVINARATNYGTRIDYILADTTLASTITACEILVDVLGSDHCPVRAVFQTRPIRATRSPSYCSKFFPEFAGRQVKLTDFLSRKRKQLDECVEPTPFESSARNTKGVKKQQSIKSFFGSNVKNANVLDSVPLGNITEASSEKFVSKNASTNATVLWKKMLSGPKPAPLCKVHQEPCVQRSVIKKGPNLNKKFWVCSRGEGRINDPQARCNYFEWY